MYTLNATHVGVNERHISSQMYHQQLSWPIRVVTYPNFVSTWTQDFSPWQDAFSLDNESFESTLHGNPHVWEDRPWWACVQMDQWPTQTLALFLNQGFFQSTDALQSFDPAWHSNVCWPRQASPIHLLQSLTDHQLAAWTAMQQVQLNKSWNI